MTDDTGKSGDWYSRRIVPALVVIGIGVFFLLGNLNIAIPFFDYANWWAWFLLCAAVVPLFHAIGRFRSVGRADAEVWRSLLAAAGIVLVALMFIVPLSWGRWWPLFVIYGGLWMLVRGPRRRRARYDDR